MSEYNADQWAVIAFLALITLIHVIRGAIVAIIRAWRGDDRN